MKVTQIILLAIFFISSSNTIAGKPWRSSVKHLAKSSPIIVIAQAKELYPSSLRTKNEKHQAIIKLEVKEVLKNSKHHDLNTDIFVISNYKNKEAFDSSGKYILMSSTAWRYWIEPGPHKYILFLEEYKRETISKPMNKDALVKRDHSNRKKLYIPIYNGSGIIHLENDRPGDGAKYLQELKKALK